MAMENSDPKRFIYYAGSIFLLAASVVMFWQMFGPSWFRNIKAEITNQPYARTVTVSAEGKINATPDIAMVRLSVVSKAPTVKQVTTDNNEKMSKIVDAVKSLGVEAKDITTSQYNLYPDYPDYQPGATRKIVGYNLTQEVTVKIRKLDTVDDVLDKATQAGANEVGALSFDIDDTGTVKKQAREQAFTKAREKAQEMAKFVGVNLGRVVTFLEDATYNPPVYANFAMDAKREAVGVAAPAPAIEPGSKELNVTVSVTYEIE